MNTSFDIIIIGSGPGGYVCAIRSAQLGYKVALVEKYNTLGGTCTNVGCIPSKALLDSSEHYHQAKNKFTTFGIELEGLELDFQQFMNRKTEVVKQNTSGLEYLMKKNKIQVIKGTASFQSNTEIIVTNEQSQQEKFTAEYIVIATGSKPKSIPNVTIDKQRIITSTEALSISEKPHSLIVIGGGVIGVEIASIFNRIGTEVTIVEYADRLIPTMDKDLGKGLMKVLKKEGIKIHTGAKVESAKNTGTSVEVSFVEKGKMVTKEADYVLIATGRAPYTKGLGLEHISVELDGNKSIITDQDCRTSVNNIFAIGDVTNGPMLAHKAEEEGVHVAEIINGQKPTLHHETIPSVVYTWPEIASVGKTEQELIDQKLPYKVSKIPIGFLGRARAAGEKDGLVKILSDPKYGEILGVHIMAPRAADLISTATVGLVYEVTDSDMTRISYPHPSYSEAIKEVFLDISGKGTISL